jgi:hypothetical protein
LNKRRCAVEPIAFSSEKSKREEGAVAVSIAELGTFSSTCSNLHLDEYEEIFVRVLCIVSRQIPVQPVCARVLGDARILGTHWVLGRVCNKAVDIPFVSIKVRVRLERRQSGESATLLVGRTKRKKSTVGKCRARLGTCGNISDHKRVGDQIVV